MGWAQCDGYGPSSCTIQSKFCVLTNAKAGKSKSVTYHQAARNQRGPEFAMTERAMTRSKLNNYADAMRASART
jgi:hypothetical protein